MVLYLLSGYRPEKADYLEIPTSLTFLHHETCNVYTHLVGALLLQLVATAFMPVLNTDSVMFGLFFWCVECSLL